ncbi:MAG: glycosyltransferase [Dehalococcoidia bacterium]
MTDHRMHWVIDLTATSSATPGLNMWAQGLVRGIAASEAARDRWTAVGTGAFPPLLRASAEAAGVRVVTPRGHRLAVQHLGLPALADRLHADGLLAASTVLPALPGAPPAVAVLHDFRHRDEPHRYGRAQRRYRDLFYGQAVRSSTRLVAISEATRAAAEREAPGAAARTSVAHHGSDHVLDWPRPPRGTHAVAFGHWPNKEPRAAVEAWARADPARTAGRLLHVIGLDDAARFDLAAFGRAHGADERLRLHGRLGDQEFRALFASAALLLFPSSHEGLGLPVLEAMRLRIPVVSSSLPAVREVAADAVWYATPGNVPAFASAVSRALAASEDDLDAAERRASSYTWAACATTVREALAAASAG